MVCFNLLKMTITSNIKGENIENTLYRPRPPRQRCEAITIACHPPHRNRRHRQNAGRQAGLGFGR